MREFRKPRGNVVYTIIDEGKYTRYWCGRKPSSRAMVEEYLTDPKATQRQITIARGGADGSITGHIKRLIRAGAMRRSPF